MKVRLSSRLDPIWRMEGYYGLTLHGTHGHIDIINTKVGIHIMVLLSLDVNGSAVGDLNASIRAIISS